MVLQLLLVFETLGAYIAFEALTLLQVRILMHFELLLGLEEFREHLGGNLCISMLTGIGSSQDVSEIDMEVMEEVLGA
jgi:3-dehydroquinate synthase